MRLCRRCRKEYEPILPSAVGAGRLCAECLPLECEFARVRALGLPAVGWRHFPGRRFLHLAAAAWAPMESFVDKVADQIGAALFGAMVLGMPLSAPGETIELGLVAVDDKEMALVTLTNSIYQNPDTFDFHNREFTRSLDYSRIQTFELSGLRSQWKEEAGQCLIEIEGDRPLVIIIPERYLVGNCVEGLAIARAMSGEQPSAADYQAAYDALEEGRHFPPRVDFDLVVPPAATHEVFAEQVVARLLPSDADQGWLLACDLSEVRRNNALTTFLPYGGIPSLLAILDTTWLGTGEAGILITRHGVYFKVYGFIVGDWTKSWHQGSFGWWQIEDVLIEEGIDGLSLAIGLPDGKRICVPMERSSSYDTLASILNQFALFNEHLRLPSGAA